MSDDSESREKGSNLLAFWLFGTVLIVFGAITAYIALYAMPLGGTSMDVIMLGLPIWGTTAVAAAIIYTGYYFYNKSKA